tara:strand:- start:288 stop:668 length:381 start_codon:yes stop_codon:yes gene_type:complete
MFKLKKFLMNQFLLGRFWLWIKPKLHGLLTLSLVIFLIFYIHGEYLSYVEFSEKFETNDRFIGTSFILKNVLMLIAVVFYLTFVFFIKKTRDNEDSPSAVKKEKIDKEKNDKAENLDFLLDEEEFK